MGHASIFVPDIYGNDKITHMPENVTEEEMVASLKMAIDSLLYDATDDWRKSDTQQTLLEYLQMNQEEYIQWFRR